LVTRSLPKTRETQFLKNYYRQVKEPEILNLGINKKILPCSISKVYQQKLEMMTINW